MSTMNLYDFLQSMKTSSGNGAFGSRHSFPRQLLLVNAKFDTLLLVLPLQVPDLEMNPMLRMPGYSETRKVEKEAPQDRTIFAGSPPHLEDFELKRDLGGGNCTNDVHLAEMEDGASGKKMVVLKKIEKDTIEPTYIKREVKAGLSLSHDGIVSFREYFEDSKHAYLVFDYIDGEDLFSFMDNRGWAPLQEDEVRRIMKQLVETTEYFHSKQFVHRDNILFDSGTTTTKMIDFGLCRKVRKEGARELDDFIGSPDYVCPEILKREPYDGYAADVWSLGVVLYILLCGELPFSRNERCFAIAGGNHPPLEWPKEVILEDDAKDLLVRMLEVDPSKRISLHEVSQHSFLKEL